MNLSNNHYDVVLNWSVTRHCNFSCPGCIAEAEKTNDDTVDERINIPALLSTLKKSKKTFKIIFSGGEPFLVENIIDAFVELSSEHVISVITNLTSNRIAEFSERVDPSRVDFVKASAHIMQLEKYNLFDTFIKNYKLLKDKGFYIFTEEVGYPNMANKVEKYKKLFQNEGIELNFQVYRGKWGTKKYPKAYTEEELAIFNFCDMDDKENNKYNRRNKKCNAGYNALVAYSDGRIFRCYNLHDYHGNLYTRFRLEKEVITCPIKSCDCPLSEFDTPLFEKAILETERVSPITTL